MAWYIVKGKLGCQTRPPLPLRSTTRQRRILRTGRRGIPVHYLSTLEIWFEGGDTIVLKDGGSFYFEIDTQHHWHNSNKQDTQVPWINIPPAF